MALKLVTLAFSSLSLSGLTFAAPAADPCVKIANQTFVPPADALACQKSFPFNETLRRNVMTNVARVFDFFTFEGYYLNSPHPFEESTANIRAQIARINAAKYATDYDFNRDLYDFTTQLNDGHTRWFPDCYTTYQSLLPTPIVTLAVNGVEDVYIAPDAVEFIEQIGTAYTGYFDSIGFNWKRLAGAKVLSIEGQSAYDYVDYVAKTISGNYLDHGVRVNSVFASYRIQSNAFSQRFGDLAGPSFRLENSSLTFDVVLANSTKPETVKIPFLSAYAGNTFTDGPSYWANNCLATEATNGVDYNAAAFRQEGERLRPLAKAGVVELGPKAYGLPPQYIPNAPPTAGSGGVIKSFVLPGNTTGVMFVGSFSPSDYYGFQTDVASAIAQMKASGVNKIIIDLTNNGGGYVCLGQFLHQYLSGSRIGYPGFESTNRASPLAQKIVTADIKMNVTNTYYSPSNWAYLNGSYMPATYNYETPAVPANVNGLNEPTSQRFHDVCTPFDTAIPEDPPFDLKNVAIVSNGNCASTCAMFSTLMVERHATKVAVFGGPRGGAPMEYKGMAGNQVLDWPDLDSEVKTAHVKNDPQAPPDLLVAGNMRVNWRTAWSWRDKSVPIAYLSERAQYRFPYTSDTYNNPQNLWTFAASKLFA